MSVCETTVHPMAAPLASDPHGCGKCHYDVGNIIDHAIAAFVSPFTSDGMFKPSWMALDLARSRRVEDTFYERNGPWQAFIYEFRQTLMFLHFEITGQRVQYKASKHKP
jgi:hypothetical protein